MIFGKSDLADIRSAIQKRIGERVNIVAKRGKKNNIIKKGIIVSAYSSVFVVKLDIDEDQVPSNRRMSFNYTDILTKSVELIKLNKMDQAV